MRMNVISLDVHTSLGKLVCFGKAGEGEKAAGVGVSYQLDFVHRFMAVRDEIFDFPAVDAHNTQQQMSRGTESKRCTRI